MLLSQQQLGANQRAGNNTGAASASTSAGPATSLVQKCPVCDMTFPPGSCNVDINSHIDECLAAFDD